MTSKQNVCRKCKESISKGAKKCPHCQTDLRNWFSRHPLITIIIVIMFIVSWISAASKPNSSNDNGAADLNSSGKSASFKPVSVGEEGYLKSTAGNGELVVATTEDVMNDITKASVAKDSMGIAELVLANKAFFVKDGVKVLVIDMGTYRRKVRVLDGDMAGKTGWVPYEFVVKQ